MIQDIERYCEDFLGKQLSVGDHVLQQYNSPINGQSFILCKIVRFTKSQCVLAKAIGVKRKSKKKIPTYYAYERNLIKVAEEDVTVYLLKKSA